MTNPARELHMLVSEWHGTIPDGGNLSHIIDPRSPEGIEQIALFYRLTSRLDDLLRGYELRGLRVGLFQRQLLVWQRAPLGSNGAWSNNGGPEGVIPAAWLDQIEGLSLYLDQKVAEFSDEQLKKLTQIVNEAIVILADDSGLPEILRRYIYDLLASVKMAMAHEHIGLSFDYEAAVRNLYAAFIAAEAKSPEKASFWADLGRKIVADVTSHFAVAATSSVATLALTQLS